MVLPKRRPPPRIGTNVAGLNQFTELRLVETPAGLSRLPKITYERRGPKQAPPLASSPMDDRPEEMIAFARQEMAANDLAPAYPILRWLYDTRGYDDQQRFWVSLLYVAYHHLPSALTAVRLLGDRLTDNTDVDGVADRLNTLPVGLERRFYSRRTAQYLKGMLGYVGEVSPKRFSAFVEHGTNLSKAKGWDRQNNYLKFYRRWQRFPGHRKRWVPAEMARVLRYVHDWPIRAPSLMLSSDTTVYPGPALRRLYRTSTTKVEVLKRLADMFRAHMEQSLMIDMDWELLDVLISKMAAFSRGRYYVGYAHDEILSHMNRLTGLHPEDRADVLAARATLFDAAYLGEANDWHGVRLERLPAWAGRSDGWPRILRPVGWT